MTSRDARRNAYWRGLMAEQAAALLLRLKGYHILAMRHRSVAGEIDLVARRKHHFAFVEVKARNTIASGLEAISPRQQQRLRRAAAAWLAQAHDVLPPDYSTSLDLVVVRRWRLPHHFPNAFGHELC